MPKAIERRWGQFTILGVALWGLVALAQAPVPPPWAGWARCQIDVQGPGYREQAIHTWTIAGSSPVVEGAFRVYPGTWSVVGRGGFQRTQGNQTLVGEWAINGQSTNAPIAVFVRASDGRMFIQARHAQLRATGAIAGYQQQTIDGKPRPPGPISAEAFEWAFPMIDVSPTSPPNTTVSGSSTPAVNGSAGYMQPAGSRGTASCTWQFAQGKAPASPPTLNAQVIPAASGGGSQSTARTDPPAVATTTEPTPTTGSTTLAPAEPPVDSSDANRTKTPPSFGSVTPPTNGRGDPTGATLALPCTMPAPVVAVTATPGGAYLTWGELRDPAAVNGAKVMYTVYRTDLGLLTPTPFPDWGFTHKTLLSTTTTYTYTVSAKYAQGCGTTSVTVRPPRPWTPVVYMRECIAPPPNSFSAWCEETQFSPRSTQSLETTRRYMDLRLTWSVPGEVVPYGGDNTGWIVRGPGLGVDGKYVQGFCGINGIGCDPYHNPEVGGYFDLSVSTNDLPTSGEYTFTVSPAWDSAAGRYYDLSSAGKVVLKIK